MRRSTAIALLLLMLAGLLAPAALATVTTPTPACCRAAGRHHCSAMLLSGTESEPQLQGQSCSYRKRLAFSGSVAPPPATETAAPADAHPFCNEFYPELFVSRSEHSHSQRAPPTSRN